MLAQTEISGRLVLMQANGNILGEHMMGQFLECRKFGFGYEGTKFGCSFDSLEQK
jgi:hypothetical protein